MKRWLGAIFLILCALLDEMISLIGCVDMTFQSLGWVPYLCFCAMYILCVHFERADRILIGAGVGIIYDTLFGSTFPVYFILYPLLLWLCGLLIQWIEEDRGIKIIVGAVAVFLLDAIPVLFSMVMGYLNVNLSVWFFHEGILTFIIHGIILYVMDRIIRTIDHFMDDRKEKRKIRHMKKNKQITLSRE